MKINISDVACWYPSAGFDIKSVNYWIRSKGNDISPNIFLFTDDGYNVLYSSSVKHGENNLLVDFNEYDYTVEYFSELIFFNGEEENPIEILNLLEDNNLYHHLSPEEYLTFIDVVSNKGEYISKKLKLNGQQLWIDGDLDVSGRGDINLGPIAGISGYLNIRNTNLSSDKLSSVLVEHIYSDIDKSKNSYIKRMACISFNNVKIIIIPAKNEVFYKYLKENSIEIDCFFVKKANHQFEYIDSLTSIGIKEAMVGENEKIYLMENDENYEKIGERFIADSTVYEDFVTLYKLKN
jgi:hypothetical protein